MACRFLKYSLFREKQATCATNYDIWGSNLPDISQVQGLFNAIQQRLIQQTTHGQR